MAIDVVVALTYTACMNITSIRKLQVQRKYNRVFAIPAVWLRQMEKEGFSLNRVSMEISGRNIILSPLKEGDEQPVS